MKAAVDLLRMCQLFGTGAGLEWPECGWCGKPADTTVIDEHDGEEEFACALHAPMTRETAKAGKA